MSDGVVTIQYLAGLFDGEGSISILKSKPTGRGKTIRYCLRIAIGMTDPRPIRAFADFFGNIGKGLVIQETPNSTRQRAMYRFQRSHDLAEQVLKQLYPFLICKKEQADIAFHFCQLMQETNCKGKIGFNRRPVPVEILNRRHRFYLKLKESKAIHFPH